MFNEKNRQTSTVNKSINTQELEFKPLKDFIGKTIKVWGFFFTKGKYGKQVVAVGEVDNQHILVNLPKRYCEDFENFSAEEVDAIVNGKMLLTEIEKISSNNGDTVAFKYADAE